MRFHLAAATIIASGLLMPALAVGQESTTGTTGTTKEMQQADMQFVKDAAAAGKAEVELGNLGTEKATAPDVKQFAQRMVNDHTKANDQLTQIATGKNIEIAPDLPPDAMTVKDRLAGLSGAEFDREFMTHMVADHEKAVELFTNESQSGKDAELKQFAEQTLPTLREHLDEAKRIESGLQQVAGTGQAPEQQTQPSAGGTTAQDTAESDTMNQPTAPEPTATQEAARPTYRLGDKTADDLIGRTVVNQNGEDVGEIADIVLDAKDRAVFAVVSVGGFLGFGEKNVRVPFEQLEPSDTDAILMSSATEEQLKALPEYQHDSSGYTALPHARPIGEGAR